MQITRNTLKGEVIGVKMEAIGGLMLKVMPYGATKSQWLCVQDNPDLLKMKMNPIIRNAINFWLKEN